MCVCLCISALTAEGLDVLVKKFSTWIDLDDILVQFDGKGHGSKVNVTRSKHNFLVCVPGYKPLAYGMTLCYATSLHDVMPSQTAGRRRCSNTLMFLLPLESLPVQGICLSVVSKHFAALHARRHYFLKFRSM